MILLTNSRVKNELVARQMTDIPNPFAAADDGDNGPAPHKMQIIYETPKLINVHAYSGCTVANRLYRNIGTTSTLNRQANLSISWPSFVRRTRRTGNPPNDNKWKIISDRFNRICTRVNGPAHTPTYDRPRSTDPTSIALGFSTRVAHGWNNINLSREHYFS